MGMPVAFFEVASEDHERAQAFYAALFDWQVSADPEMGGYGLVDTGAEGGLRGPATPASRFTFGCPICRRRSPVPRSSAGRRRFRPRTCRGTTDGSRSSPTRTATRSGSGLEMSGDDLRSEQATDDALRALAEPRRRAILRLVADAELPAGQIAEAFDVTRTAVSQHLSVLKNAGLLHERRDGTRRLYRARAEGLAGLQAFLDQMWATSLQTAARLVEAERGVTDDGRTNAAG